MQLTAIWKNSKEHKTCSSILFLYRDVKLFENEIRSAQMKHLWIGPVPWIPTPIQKRDGEGRTLFYSSPLKFERIMFVTRLAPQPFALTSKWGMTRLTRCPSTSTTCTVRCATPWLAADTSDSPSTIGTTITTISSTSGKFWAAFCCRKAHSYFIFNTSPFRPFMCVICWPIQLK